MDNSSWRKKSTSIEAAMNYEPLSINLTAASIDH